MSGRRKAIDPSQSEHGARQPAIIAVAARCGAAALAIMLLAGEAAWADCSPAAANNVVATCTGTTFNQGAGAPGTSADSNGYGTITETGVTVTIDSNATVTGTFAGVFVGDGTIINGAGATVSGHRGIGASSGPVNVTNSGNIAGETNPFASPDYGILSHGDATVTNNAGATIIGGPAAIRSTAGSSTVINSGSITATSNSFAAIYGFINATVTNNAGASIVGRGTRDLHFPGICQRHQFRHHHGHNT